MASCLRRFRLWKLPRVLVIHLKRFQQSNYYRRKLDTKVSIPERLSLKDFTDKDNASYELQGIIKHAGFINGGHYTADCKVEGRWYDFNDSHVSRTEPSLSGSSPYVLLYTLL